MSVVEPLNQRIDQQFLPLLEYVCPAVELQKKELPNQLGGALGSAWACEISGKFLE